MSGALVIVVIGIVFVIVVLSLLLLVMLMMMLEDNVMFGYFVFLAVLCLGLLETRLSC